MKLSLKVMPYIVVAGFIFWGIKIIVMSAVHVAEANNGAFFDSKFAFLAGYSVSGLIVPAVLVLALIGWSCGLWMLNNIWPLTENVPGNGNGWSRYLPSYLPLTFIVAVLVLFGLFVWFTYPEPVYDGVKVFSIELSRFFLGGLFMGVGTFFYGYIHRPQQTGSI